MTKQEIATHKRLRLACEFLGKLADNEPADLPPSDLSEEAVSALRQYEADNLQAADLLAIRNRPGQWCLTNPYNWLWVLHRYQNRQDRIPTPPTPLETKTNSWKNSALARTD